MPQVEGASSSCWVSARSMPSLTVTRSRPWRGASSSTAASQAGPSYHQWPSSSVSSAQQSSPPPATRSDRTLDEVARVLAGQRERRLAVVRPAGVVPRPEVVHGAAVVVAVGVVDRVAVAVVPDQLDRLPVDRHGHRPGLGGDRAEVVEALDPRLVDAERAHAVVGEVALEPGRVRALRQPEAAAPVAEAAHVGRPAGGQLQAQAGVGGQHRQQRVGRARRPQLDALEVGERARAGRGRGARRPRRRTCSRRRRGAPRRPARARRRCRARRSRRRGSARASRAGSVR